MTVELVPAEAEHGVRPRSKTRSRSQDISGFGVFAEGDIGEAHVMAHRLLDEGRHELGHRWLGAWLDTHEGAGSDWTHIQWHMAVFELAIGRWDDAWARFEEHILPVATHTANALTDAPAMLWRLRLSATRPVELPWEPVRATAARRLQRPSDPYVELHCLLALAGAGDIAGLDQWIHARPDDADTEQHRLLAQMAIALRAFAGEDYPLAAAMFATAVPHVGKLGGSRAQNQLFQQISELSWKRAREMTSQAA